MTALHISSFPAIGWYPVMLPYTTLTLKSVFEAYFGGNVGNLENPHSPFSS